MDGRYNERRVRDAQAPVGATDFDDLDAEDSDAESDDIFGGALDFPECGAFRRWCPSNPYADHMLRTNQRDLGVAQEFARELSARPRLQGDDLTGDDPDSFRQLSALDRQTAAEVVSDVHALQDDLARMHRDVATRDGRAAARRNAQAYNAYDTFADTAVQDSLAGASYSSPAILTNLCVIANSF